MIRLLSSQLNSLTHLPKMHLTKQQAMLRSTSISPNINNTLYIELLKGKYYRAFVQTQFKLKQQNNGLFLDYQGPPVKSIYLNEIPLDISHQKDQKIYLPQQHLKQENTIYIQFENSYSTSGHGLHSFMDGEDQYVYSQCEPYHASKIFPCFDQPDLKGFFNLVTYAPIEWTIISNEATKQVQDKSTLNFLNSHNYFLPSPSYKIDYFQSTKPLSTYLYAILAGPYVSIVGKNLKVPQTLYCRKSLYQHVEKDAAHIFKVTDESMEFFEKLFGYKYPFSKYDQIFCPEYSTGAMENAGAVTINDLYVFKEEVPKAQRASRANTIIHELSHMWFGDLVTMKWWDDLWLNESFAEFISHLCQDSVCEKDVNYWVQFFERKLWGYATDEKSTTHPIFCNIENTDQAENIFDGITYAKGAALLKQIYYLMGQQDFTRAMTNYFNKYQYSNTTLDDFFREMAIVQSVDWEQFKQDWIMTSGFNTLGYVVNNKQLTISQDGNYLRNHQLKIGIIKGNQIEVQYVKISKQPTTTITLNEAPDGIILNYDDECYVKTIYTQEQTKMLLNNLSLIQNSLNRLVILHSIFNQVRDGETCFSTFAQPLLKHLLKESDDTALIIVLQWLSVGVSFYTPIKHRDQLRELIASTLEQMLRENMDINRRLTIRSHYVAFCRTPERLNKLDIKELGIKDGWTMIYNTYLHNEKREDLYQIVAQKDNDFKKHQRFLQALEQRDQLWNYFINYQKEESLQMVAQAMRAFNHEKFCDQLIQYEEKFFNEIIQIFEKKEAEYAKTFYTNLFPVGDNVEKYINLSQQVLKNCNNDFLSKQLKDSIDNCKRKQKSYKTYQQQ